MLHNGILQAPHALKNAIINSIIIARFVESAVMKLCAIYSDYIRKLVDGVWLDDMLPLYSVILIIFEPCRRVVIIFVRIIL